MSRNPLDYDKHADRRRNRQMKCVTAAMKISQAQGGLDLRANMEHCRLASLAAVAEARALWFFLIERGICTEDQRQDYLDKGYDSVLADVDAGLTKILVAGNG